MIPILKFEDLAPEDILNRDIQAEEDVSAAVDAVLAEVKSGGDTALKALTKRFDGAELEELQVTEDDLDSISGFPRTIEGVEIGVMIRNSEPGKAKLSVRTAPGYDASAYCARLGGGGHAAAAGCATETGAPETLRSSRTT